MITLDARLKVLALSDKIFDGIPLLLEKRLKQFMKVLALRLGTSSRCTARVVQHVNKQSQLFGFCDTLEAFTYCGPAKSTPTNWNGLD